ncbi:MAG TPA: hypothetical protein VFE33_32275 [Thermoanaerobaculia bacterium]|nr:hypothetical protein [Thermoanaerobaculia bacterium]
MTGPVFVSYARKSPDEAPAPAILPQYEGVMHWQNLIGLDQAVGRFVVLADRFRFESEKRSFEMRFDAIVAIKAGDIMLTIQTAQGKRYFSRDTFAVPAPALAAELQSHWLAGRPRA